MLCSANTWSFPAPVTNVVGFGVPTDVTCVVGSEVKFEESDQGDGTVALKSSAWIQGPGVRTLSIPIGAYPTNAIPQRHPRLWDSPPVLQILNEVLLDAPAPSHFARPFGALMLRAGIDLLPDWAGDMLGLSMNTVQRQLIRASVRRSVPLLRWAVRNGSLHRARRRMGLPPLR